MGIHSHALAIFEVDDLHRAVGDDHGVTGAERFGDVLGEVQAGLHEQLGVRGLLPSCAELLQHDAHVGVGVVFHFGGVVLGVLCHLLLFLARVLLQPQLQLHGADGVRERSLIGIGRALLFLLRLEQRGGCAVQPPVG